MRLAKRLLLAGILFTGLGVFMKVSGTYKPEDNMARPIASILIAGVVSTGLGAYLMLRSFREGGSSGAKELDRSA